MTKKHIDKLIADHRIDGYVFIGDEDTRELYYPAIVSRAGGRFTYDYDKLVDCFARSFMDPQNLIDYDHGIVDDDVESAWYEAKSDAIEWIDYNVVRSLPYWGPSAPHLRYRRDH